MFSNSFLVYRFTCVICSSSHIGKNCRDFKIKFEEYIKKYKKGYSFKHLYSMATCFESCNSPFPLK